ncbi:MAG: tyrosine-type recombinase/integrase [Solirubrobacteraceae bacterium]
MSALQEAAREYLEMRRALGFKLRQQGRMLLQFVDYLEQQSAEVITTELALEWACLPEGVSQLWWRQRLAVVRDFARHLSGLDPRTEVPPSDLLPARSHRAVPYLYSDAEVARLIEAARMLAPPLHAGTYATLIGLLFVTGLRVGEALGLDREDVDLDDGWLLVRRAKNDYRREVPVHQSSIQALQAYARLRDDLCPHPVTESFLVTITGERPSYNQASKAFDKLRRATGLSERRSPSGRLPRMHDMRHGFILRTLLGWYREDSDVEAKLPLLSTFVGHINPKSSYWYFEGAPELLALAAERLEREWGKLS